jgi:hypothetical protein
MFPSPEIPKPLTPDEDVPKAVPTTPIMPKDISLDTVYIVDGKTFTNKNEAAHYQQRRQREVAEAIVKQLPQSHDNQTIFYEIWDQYNGKKHCHERHTSAEKAYNRMGKVTNYFPDKLWIDQVIITENADGTVDLNRQLVYRHKF